MIKKLLNPYLFLKKKYEQRTGQRKVNNGILITVPGASFDLFLNDTYSYFGFVDLTTLLHGDEIEILEYIKPWCDTDFKLHKSQKFNGPVEFPLISFPIKILDCPVKIVLKQNTGMRREILYSFKSLSF